MSDGAFSAGISQRACEDLREVLRDGVAPDLSDLIPRPRGSLDDSRHGYVLRNELGLINDAARYKASSTSC
jgi:hypothetical protein